MFVFSIGEGEIDLVLGIGGDCDFAGFGLTGLAGRHGMEVVAAWGYVREAEAAVLVGHYIAAQVVTRQLAWIWN